MVAGTDSRSVRPDHDRGDHMSGCRGGVASPGRTVEGVAVGPAEHDGCGPVNGASTSPLDPLSGTTTVVAWAPHHDPSQLKLQFARPSRNALSEYEPSGGSGSSIHRVDATPR